MTTLPNIIITQRDADRLEALIDGLAEDRFPGKALLQRELERAQVVPSEQIPGDVVTMNSTVRFRMADTGKEFSLSLVYPRDADGSPDRISIVAPVGSALLGLREGDTIHWPMPGGQSAQVHILSVTYQPERSGDYAL